ncbi:MAG: hypothetical protein WAW61_20175 [Methylococcaceae bacterium]
MFERGDLKPCALCLEFKDLKRSHAIPNSVFKKLFNRGGGQAIVVNNDVETYAKRTNDSWWEHQLCLGCERHLNESYEEYSLLFLRGKRGKKIEHDRDITFSEVDITKIQLFFLSIFWRAANSEDLAYSHVFIPEPWNNELREYIFKKLPVPLNLATVKISCLTYKGKMDGDSEKIISGIIKTPFLRIQLYNHVSFCFLFEGFFIEIFTPGFGFKREGIINPKKNVLVVPVIDLFDILEMKEAIKVGIQKGFKDKAK